MEQALQLFILLPLVGFILSIFFSNRQEKIITIIAIGTIGIQLASLLTFTTLWIINGSDVLDYKHITFYKEESIEIFLEFYFDKITATFSLLGAFITLIVVIFSKYYLHRDSGFKRFFNTVLLFYFGLRLKLNSTFHLLSPSCILLDGNQILLQKTVLKINQLKKMKIP